MTEITVVIPTFKRPDFLGAAIASVGRAAQALPNRDTLEIVVVDDGHCDITRRTCAEALTGLDHSIHYLRTSRPGCGPAAARNAGVYAASGNYVYLLDDDDQFLPNRFGRSLPLLQSGAYDVVFERTLRVFDDGSNRASYVSGPDGRELRSPAETIKYMISVDETGHITPAAVSFSKDIFLRLGGQDERLRFGEDGEFLLRLGAFSSVAFLANDPVATCFFHARNCSQTEYLRYHQNIKALSHFYHKVKCAKSDVRRTVQRVLAHKLDFVLTVYRQESPTYLSRLVGGAKALWYFSWDCLTWNNVKSIGVWLLKGRTA